MLEKSSEYIDKLEERLQIATVSAKHLMYKNEILYWDILRLKVENAALQHRISRSTMVCVSCCVICASIAFVLGLMVAETFT